MVWFGSHLTRSETTGGDKLFPDNCRQTIGKSEYFRTTFLPTKGGEFKFFPICQFRLSLYICDSVQWYHVQVSQKPFEEELSERAKQLRERTYRHLQETWRREHSCESYWLTWMKTLMTTCGMLLEKLLHHLVHLRYVLWQTWCSLT